MAIKLKNNEKLLDMDVKHRTLKISHSSALVYKNATIATVKSSLRETVDTGANLKKDVKVAMKNANSNEKLSEDRKKKAYDMAINVQYLKDELEDSRDKANCLQVKVINLQVLKRYVELRAGHLDREILYIKVEMKVRLCLSSVSH